MATDNNGNCNCNNPTASPLRRIYYKDDFDFFLTLLDCEGLDIGVPTFDWRARLYTSSRVNYVTVSSIGGVLTNCRIDDGRIHVFVNSHHLTVGKLHVDFEALLPNEVYPDGSRRTVKPCISPIELTYDGAPCPSAIDIELMLPYIRGKAFTFDDFTPEQLDGLAQQAADHVTIENLGVAGDDEVDAEMGKLVGLPAPASKSTFRLDRRIRRGIMPAKARPGIMYYDYGLIKIKPYRGYKDPVFQPEWDLSAYKDVIGDDLKLYPFGSYSNNVHTTLEGALKNEAYEYDPETAILRFDGTVITEDMSGLVLVLELNYRPEYNGTEYSLDRPGGALVWRDNNQGVPPCVLFIGADGKLRRGLASDFGAAEYEAPAYTDAEVRDMADRFFYGDNSEYQQDLFLKTMKCRVWTRRKTKTKRDDDGKRNFVRKKWAFNMSLSYKHRLGREWTGTFDRKMGVLKVVRKTGGGYKSKPRVFWCAKKESTDSNVAPGVTIDFLD